MTESPAAWIEEVDLVGDVIGEASQILVRPGPAQESMARDLKEILDYIHAHLADESLSVKTVRRSCRIGNHNVSSRFQLAIGVSISDYIKTLRMEAASRLLERLDLPIYRVGSLVGFSHQESFTRTFRRHFGCTPSAYRRNLLDEDPEAGQDELSRPSV